MRRDPSKWSVPVTYKGIRFRSRLEARWAVFFDVLGIKYEYEPLLENVRTTLGVEVRYAPDFIIQLDDWELTVEIKPKEPTRSELTKAAAWAKEINDVLILFGPVNPPPDGVQSWMMWVDTDRKTGRLKDAPTLYKDFWFSECPRCGHIHVGQHGSLSAECLEDCFKDMEEDELVEFAIDYEGHLAPRLLDAYEIAGTYKFQPSTSRAKPKFPEGPPTYKMADFLVRLLNRRGDYTYSVDHVLHGMKFSEVKAMIDELLRKEDDEWW